MARSRSRYGPMIKGVGRRPQLWPRIQGITLRGAARVNGSALSRPLLMIDALQYKDSMKVLLIAHGTRGDIQPFVALARALVIAGHRSILAAPANSAPLANQYGLEFRPLKDTWHTLMSDRTIRTGVETNFRGIQGKFLAAQFARLYRSTLPALLDDIASLATLSPDLIVSQPVVSGHEIAERLHIPAVPACLFPAWVPTRAFTNPMLPVRVPRSFNLLSYAFTQLWIRCLTGSTTKWRSTCLELPKRRHHQNPLKLPDGHPADVLQAFSHLLLPESAKYPDHVHTTGYWFLPSPPNWAPSSALSAFLKEGPRPVYIGFGSLVGSDARQTGRVIRDAVRRARVRAIVVTGEGGIEPDGSCEDVLYINEAPFHWLFPRVSLIVHHGGSGTTGDALAAGRPQVVCPFAAPQPFHALRVQALGVAPQPIPQSELTADRLSTTIREALSDVEMADRAERLGRLVRAEDGAQAAVKILESLVRLRDSAS